MPCWSIRVSSAAIFPLNLNVKPIPSHGLPSLHLFSTSFLHDLVCIRPNYTLSLFHFNSAVPYTWESYRTLTPYGPFMNIPRSLMPCILHFFSGFSVISRISISSPPHRHWFLIHTVPRLPQTYSNISLLSHRFPRFFISFFNPVSHPLFSWSNFMLWSTLSILPTTFILY